MSETIVQSDDLPTLDKLGAGNIDLAAVDLSVSFVPGLASLAISSQLGTPREFQRFSSQMGIGAICSPSLDSLRCLSL
jgi:hypothetical protein